MAATTRRSRRRRSLVPSGSTSRVSSTRKQLHLDRRRARTRSRRGTACRRCACSIRPTRASLGAGEGAGLVAEELALEHASRAARRSSARRGASRAAGSSGAGAAPPPPCPSRSRRGPARRRRRRRPGGSSRAAGGSPGASPISGRSAGASAAAARSRRFSSTSRRFSAAWATAVGQPLAVERLGDEVVDPVLHRRDRELDVGVAGDEQHRQVGVDRLDPLEELQPVHPRHADVGDDRPLEVLVDRGERRLGAVEGRAPRSPRASASAPSPAAGRGRRRRRSPARSCAPSAARG